MKKHKWSNFNDGRSIGQTGSEGGVITVDLENNFGARLTVEKEGNNSPYSVTMTIKGLMDHTKLCENEAESSATLSEYKTKIDQIITHHDIPETQKDERWKAKLYKILDGFSEL